MDDILSLRNQVKQLQNLAQQLEPFVKSFTSGVTAGEVSMTASDVANNQHLQALLHLARLHMQEPSQPQTQAPTKDRHSRTTATSADNALYMKGIYFSFHSSSISTLRMIFLFRNERSTTMSYSW